MNAPHRLSLTTGRAPSVSARSRQSGVILAVTLIVLVIMLVSSIALIRSFGTSVAIAGNLASRRDLLNQAEKAVYTVVDTDFSTTTPTLTQVNRLTNNTAFNYSACQLNVDAHGVPVILSDTDANFTGGADLSTEPWTDSGCHSNVGSTANDIFDSATSTTIRYVIDRLCVATGNYTSSGCTTTPLVLPGYITTGTPNVNSPGIPVYRLSVRATDARGSRTYVQTTFSN